MPNTTRPLYLQSSTVYQLDMTYVGCFSVSIRQTSGWKEEK